MVTRRVRAYYEITRAMQALGLERRAIPDVARAAKNITSKIGAATRTQERITLGRIKGEIDRIKPESPATIETATEKIQQHIREHGERVAPMAARETQKGTELYYSRVKEGWEREMDVPATWSVADEEAQRIITQWDHTFIGDHYRDTVTARAEKVIRDTITEAEGAMSRREIAARLKTEMRDVIRPRGYWETVAAQDVGVARSWSSMRFFREADIDSYEIVAMMDSRTSEICRYMNGKILTVEKTLDRLAEYKNAETAEEAKAVNAWLTAGMDAEGKPTVYAGDSQLGANMSGEDLQELGVNSPPYHARCRTILVMA